MNEERESRGGSEQLPRMSLLDHLSELRRRLVKALAGFAVAFSLSWIWVEEIAEFLARPIYRFLPEGEKLIFLGVTDPFILYVKVAALAAIFVASPWVAWQAWGFVSPGLYKREKLWAVPFVLAGSDDAAQHGSNGGRRHLGQLECEIPGLLKELVDRPHFIHEADPERLGPRDLLRSENHVQRVVASDAACQARAAPPCGYAAQVELR